VSLETLFNFAWAALGLLPLAGLAISEFVGSGRSSALKRVYRLAAVLLCVLALFPAISFSDDLFFVSLYHPHSGRPAAPVSSSDVFLARAFHLLDVCEFSGAPALPVAALAVALVAPLSADAVGRHAPSHAGRGPPSLSFSAA
jgi:hypothetical protein